MLRPDEDNSLLLDWCVHITVHMGIALPDSPRADSTVATHYKI